MLPGNPQAGQVLGRRGRGQEVLRLQGHLPGRQGHQQQGQPKVEQSLSQLADGAWAAWRKQPLLLTTVGPMLTAEAGESRGQCALSSLGTAGKAGSPGRSRRGVQATVQATRAPTRSCRLLSFHDTVHPPEAQWGAWTEGTRPVRLSLKLVQCATTASPMASLCSLAVPRAWSFLLGRFSAPSSPQRLPRAGRRTGLHAAAGPAPSAPGRPPLEIVLLSALLLFFCPFPNPQARSSLVGQLPGELGLVGTVQRPLQQAPPHTGQGAPDWLQGCAVSFGDK